MESPKIIINPFSKKPVAFVFDVDYTLIIPEPSEIRRKTLWMVFRPVKDTILRPYFDALVYAKMDVYILTALHPDLRADLSAYFKIPEENILCRNYYKTVKEMTDVSKNPVEESKFLRTTYDQKVEALNGLTKQYLKVISYDDECLHIAECGKETLNENVVLLPVLVDYRDLIELYSAVMPKADKETASAVIKFFKNLNKHKG